MSRNLFACFLDEGPICYLILLFFWLVMLCFILSCSQILPPSLSNEEESLVFDNSEKFYKFLDKKRNFPIFSSDTQMEL